MGDRAVTLAVRRRPAAALPSSLLDVDQSALAIVERLLDCAERSRRPSETWRFLGFAASNLDELLTTHGPSDDIDMTCMLDDVRPPEYRRAIRALLRRVSALQQQALGHGRVGPVAWAALSGTSRDAAQQWLDAHWPDIFARPSEPLFLPSRRLAMVMQCPDRGAWVMPLPDGVSRFVPVGARGSLLPIEALLTAVAAVRAPTLRITPVRVLRRERTFAWHDLAERPEDGVPQLLRVRAGGPLFALEHASSMSGAEKDRLRQLIEQHPGPRETRVRWLGVGPLLDAAPLASLPAPAVARMQMRRRTPPVLPAGRIAELLLHGDRLVGFPGHDFGATVVRFVEEAVADPTVTDLDATVYRVDAASAIMQQLMTAAQRGVRVRVTTELEARGDEMRNLDWAARLRAAGVMVDTGPAALKVHAKLLLVRRGTSAPAQAFIGTGNLHAGTARAYHDYGLFTAAPALTADVVAVFAAIRGSAPPALQALAAAPWTLRETLLALLERAEVAVGAGRSVQVLVKLNGLTDPLLIDAVQGAAAAGVRIRMSVRGLCLVRPRPDGRLRVIAPAGHLLHHARGLALVENGRVTAAWIGSADWRERNLDRRVEVWAPLAEPAHRAFLAAAFAADMRRSAGWELRPDGRYHAPGRTGQTRREA